MKSIKKLLMSYAKGLLLSILIIVTLFLTANYLNNPSLFDNEAYIAVLLILVIFTPLGMGHTIEFLLGSEHDDKLQKIKNKSAK